MWKLPIVYHHQYNSYFYGLEKLNSFDSQKFAKIFTFLCEKNQWDYENFYHPEQMIADEDLLLVHTPEYITNVNTSSWRVARIIEQRIVATVPMSIIRPRIIEPMKLGSQGTIVASELALEHGWAINLSGGYHHAKADQGEGFCIYADVAIAIRKLMNIQADGSVNQLPARPPRIQRPLIIDLDAHQGNGYLSLFTHIKTDGKGQEKHLEFVKNVNIKIFDIYNGDIFPKDQFARKFVDYDYPIDKYTETTAYLTVLKNNLPRALEESRPDIVIYNAGTDIYELDRLGELSISEEGIVERDEYVFRLCRERNIPIVMVLSGGYGPESARVIFNSIQNLINKKIVQLPSPPNS